MQRTVAVISAGLGVPSTTRMLADQLAADVVARSAQQNIEVVLDVIELREHATDIANAMVAGYAGPALAQVIERVAAADAMIAVTPTFSASYSGLFKSFFDGKSAAASVRSFKIKSTVSFLVALGAYNSLSSNSNTLITRGTPP